MACVAHGTFLMLETSVRIAEMMHAVRTNRTTTKKKNQNDLNLRGINLVSNAGTMGHENLASLSSLSKELLPQLQARKVNMLGSLVA